jgi:hypothetical protein
VKIPNLDVTDDYTSEKDQIKKIKGKKYRFSFGDYVVKSMVGSIDSKLGMYLFKLLKLTFFFNGIVDTRSV